MEKYKQSYKKINISGISFLIRPEQFNFLFFEPAKLRFSKIGKKNFKIHPCENGK